MSWSLLLIVHTHCHSPATPTSSSSLPQHLHGAGPSLRISCGGRAHSRCRPTHGNERSRAANVLVAARTQIGCLINSEWRKHLSTRGLSVEGANIVYRPGVSLGVRFLRGGRFFWVDILASSARRCGTHPVGEIILHSPIDRPVRWIWSGVSPGASDLRAAPRFVARSFASKCGKLHGLSAGRAILRSSISPVFPRNPDTAA